MGKPMPTSAERHQPPEDFYARLDRVMEAGSLYGPPCKFNSEVWCYKKSCGKCGWNPDVSLERRTKIRKARKRRRQETKFFY